MLPVTTEKCFSEQYSAGFRGINPSFSFVFYKSTFVNLMGDLNNQLGRKPIYAISPT